MSLIRIIKTTQPFVSKCAYSALITTPTLNFQIRTLSSSKLFKKDPKFDDTQQYDDAVHPRQRASEQAAIEWATHTDLKSMTSKDLKKDPHFYLLDHPIWDDKELEDVKPTHRKPKSISDHLAYRSVQFTRFLFDLFSGYLYGGINEKKVLSRVVFLETVAGVPGMVGAMIRHLHSLRLMRRDYGWIHTLLEEAENERMHLLVAIKLKKPGYLVRAFVLLAQGVFVNFWFLAYLISPKFCHRFVGYLEEEAVKTYTTIVDAIDAGKLKEFESMPAPVLARTYWRLKSNANMREMFLNMRADEKHHCRVNHGLASQGQLEPNPWAPGR